MRDQADRRQSERGYVIEDAEESERECLYQSNQQGRTNNSTVNIEMANNRAMDLATISGASRLRQASAKDNEATSKFDPHAEKAASAFDDATLSNGSGTKNSAIKRRFVQIANYGFLVLFLIGYLVYTGMVIYLKPSESVFICILAVFITFFVVNKLSKGECSKSLNRLWSIIYRQLKPKKIYAIWIRRGVTIAAVLGIVVFLILDLWDQWEKWTPVAGLVVFILISVALSTNPRKINWMPVIWGLILQFCLGILVIRWKPGFQACQWIGDQVVMFLGYTDAGSSFVFGEAYTQHPVVFKILPVVVFFSGCVSVMYYIGAMQGVIKSIAFVLQAALKTTPIESFATALHIFVGQVESSVALRPFWMSLTESEIHAIMTGGFATVAGTVIAAYIEFGAPAVHVISASFMSAPAALAIAKISLPETQVSKIKTQKEIKLPAGQETNMVEALSVGATAAIKLVAYVVVNLIAFIAVLAFLDTSLGYFGSKVNLPELSFQLICSYIFMPIAAAMGVPWEECNVVGALIGKKIIVSEFLAYIDLGALITDGTLKGRSMVIATYVLCGFGSIPAIGINLGALFSAAPGRRADFSRLSWRALLNGNIACFMTACIAALLYQTGDGPMDLLTPDLTNTTLSPINATLTTTVSNILNITTTV